MRKDILFRREASPDDPIVGYDRIERRYITMSECFGIAGAMPEYPDVTVGFDRVDGTPIKSGDVYRVVGLRDCL
ncbi:MAG: hypothetical protein JXC85_05135 [Candidatus Aenigmarchaeota archaeon]|nr:hypothetical protein [Candidatus Aenigmarchaeota archaeon]